MAKLNRKVIGKKMISQAVKVSGNEKSRESESKDSDTIADHGDVTSLRAFSFSGGRTIEIGSFEFCRIKIEMMGSVEEGGDIEAVKHALQMVVIQSLQKEEAGVNGEVYPLKIADRHWDVLAKLKNRGVYLSYGLTLKSPTHKFESNVVDVMEYRPISDGMDLMSEFDTLSDEIAGWLTEQRNRLKNVEASGL